MAGGAPHAAAVRPVPPARVFWPAVLVFDLALLLLLPRAPWVLLGLAAAATALVLVQRGAAALAFVLAGLPLLQGIEDVTRDPRPAFFIGLGLLIAAVLLRLWHGIWEPRRLHAVLSLPRRTVWLFGTGLGLLMLLGLTRTPAPIYGGDKTQLYWMSNLALLTASILLLAREPGETGPPREARLFLRVLLGIEIGLALGAVWNFFTQFYPFHDRLTAWGLNPIWVARHAGLGILVALVLAALRLLRRRWLWFLLPLFGWVFVEAGSRGPALALAAALVLWFLSAPLSTSARRRRLLGVGLVGLALLALLAIELTGREHATGQQLSNQVRLWLLRAAREALSGISLFGVGTGGFSALLGLPDARWYPHNLLLEVLLENGLLGLALVLGLIGATYAGWRRWGRVLRGRAGGGDEATLRRGVGALFLFAVLCAQFSGDIWVNEWVWAFAGVVSAWVPREPG